MRERKRVVTERERDRETETERERGTHVIIDLEPLELHSEREPEEAVHAHGRQVKDATHGLQLLATQVLQGQLVLKELGVLDDLISRGLYALCSDLLSTQINKSHHDSFQKITYKC